MPEKSGASKIVARMKGILKSRMGRRPIRVANLLKKASQSGADLRLPVMGGTKFPTNDSLSEAKKTLKEHQDVAKPKMERPVVQPVYGVNMPKLGSAFSEDPLVQYLKKTAEASKVDSEGKLSTNEKDMKTGPEEKELASDLPEPPQGKKVTSQWRSQLNELFSNKEGIADKYTDKDHDGLKLP